VLKREQVAIILQPRLYLSEPLWGVKLQRCAFRESLFGNNSAKGRGPQESSFVKTYFGRKQQQT